MHFSQEAAKDTYFEINGDQNCTLEEIQAGCSAEVDAIFCSNEDDFLILDGFCEFDENDPGALKSITSLISNTDEIGARLNDTVSLSNSVANGLSASSRIVIDSLLEQISKLSNVEKLFLYLKLPTGKNPDEPLKLPENPLGSRSEIVRTITWIKTHLKEDKDTSIPKQDVYTEYIEFCNQNSIKPLSTADFGKVMKQVYPNVRPRRLGTRGNSRYCYSGMTCRADLPAPKLPLVGSSDEGERTCAWAAQVLGTPISSLLDLETHLAERGLPASLPPLAPPPPENENTYIMNSKIAKSPMKKPNNDNENKKQKHEKNSDPSNKTTPERCKGKKRNNIQKDSNCVEEIPKKDNEKTVKKLKSTEPESEKVAIPRLPQLNKKDQPLPPIIRRQPKPLQPKHDQTYVENVNSSEQEEELLRYFHTGGEDPKVSQLKLLLEKKGDKSQSKRRVSFETVPESPKKFSFVPISPVSPFLHPQQRGALQRSNSCNSPVGKGPRPIPPPRSFAERSQSVPMVIPQDTPVPAEIIDFGLDSEQSNLLVIDQSSDSLLIDSSMNNDNFSTIFSIINEMENHSKSYSSTPTTGYAHPIPPPSVSSTTDLIFGDLDCDVAVSNLAADLITDLNV